MYGSVARFPLSQLLYRLHDPDPHGFPLHIAGSKALVGPHGRLKGRIFAMLANQDVGRAVCVQVGYHGLGLTDIVATSSSLSLDTFVSPRHGRPQLGAIDLGGHSAMMSTGHDVRGLAR